jgi:hypothetical protein
MIHLLNLWATCILHLRILTSARCFLCLLLGLALGLFLSFALGQLFLEDSALSSRLFFLLAQAFLALGFQLVEVALDDGACDGAELFDFGYVDGLGGVFAFVVEPVLDSLLVWVFLSHRVFSGYTYLGLGAFLTDSLFLVFVGELGILFVNFVAEIIDEAFQLVLLIFGVGD